MVRAACNGATSVPFTVIGLMVKVRVEEPRSTPPASVLVVLTLEESAVTLPVRVRRPPAAGVAFTVGAAPPLLLKVRPARELRPSRFSVPPPLMTGTVVEAI